VGLFSLAVATAVQPQAGGWPVHSVALLLRICCVMAGGLAMLMGTRLVLSAWRDRHTARQQDKAGCPSCPPGLRPLLVRNDRGAGFRDSRASVWDRELTVHCALR
jgi:hypothetical protein